MSNRFAEELIPFDYGWYQSDDFEIVFYDVVFGDNWGPFQRGDHLNSLSIDFVKGKVCEYNSYGLPVRTLFAKMVPV